MIINSATLFDVIHSFIPCFVFWQTFPSFYLSWPEPSGGLPCSAFVWLWNCELYALGSRNLMALLFCYCRTMNNPLYFLTSILGPALFATVARWSAGKNCPVETWQWTGYPVWNRFPTGSGTGSTNLGTGWTGIGLSLIHIWRCRRIERCRSRWSPYH